MNNLPSSVIPNTRWYHISVTGGELFVDGIKIGSAGTGNGGARSLIGAKWNESLKKSENHFSGWIEEVRIWNTTLTEDQIQFMMNQRLIANGALMGEQIPMNVPGGLTYANLLGYYRLISAEPEPLAVSPVVYLDEDKPTNGLTPDRATNKVPGVLKNMETNQENTAPLPYYSGNDGAWGTNATWLRPDVWVTPHTGNIIWNIVRTSHDIQSGDKNIIVLGLLSDTQGKLLEISAPGTKDEYNEGRSLRVTHYLELDGNIDLVGESQLLQDPGSILAESSKGWLERDQQGTQSSFNYNYWSSPVSIQGKPNNSGYTVGEVLGNPKGVITYVNDPFAADATPLNSNNVIISSYWLWTYYPDTVNDYDLWKEIWETGTVSTGGGFTMKGTSGAAQHMIDKQNYAFRGKPHNGDFTLTIGPDQNFLIGNPYPSAIDGKQFILDNLNKDQVVGATNTKNVFDGAIYFWDHFSKTSHILKEYEGGYAVLNLVGGVPAISDDYRIDATGKHGTKTPKDYIPVGQAFLINSADYTDEAALYGGINGGDITFKNSQRAFIRDNELSDDAIFLKPENVEKESKNKEIRKDTKIRISFRSPVGYYRQLLVGAVPNTTNGFDLGYDALLLDYNLEDMYWIQGNNYLVIQGVPHFEKDQVLPLGVKISEEKEFTIQIDTIENPASDLKIYLKDKVKDSIHYLSKSAYKSISEPGYIHDRFEIIFYYEEELPVDPGAGDKDYGIVLRVRHSYANRQIQILNPDQVEISNLYLFDLNGNLLEDYDQITNEKEIILPVQGYSSGVYILKLYAKDKVISKKIIISN